MVSLVYSGAADIGVGDFTVTKERSEVVAFIDTVEISRYGTMLLCILQKWPLKFNLLMEQSAELTNSIPAALILLFISAKYRCSYFPNYMYALLPSSVHTITQWERLILQCSLFLVQKTWEPPWSPNFISFPISPLFVTHLKGGRHVLWDTFVFLHISFHLYIFTNNTGQQRFCSTRKTLCLWCIFGRWIQINVQNFSIIHTFSSRLKGWNLLR